MAILWLGSIRIAAATNNPTIKEAFITIMRNVVASALTDAAGETPTWGKIHRAPEHERAGHS